MISFFILAAEMLGPIYAIFVRSIGGDILEAGAAWSIFMIISGVGIFFMGRIENKLRKDKFFMICGYSLICLGFLGYYFISNVTQLFIIQIVLGIGTMIVIPARDSFYTQYLEKGKFTSQWAAWESVAYITSGLGALIGAFIAKIFGFKYLFLIMFTMSFVGLILSMQLNDKND